MAALADRAVKMHVGWIDHSREHSATKLYIPGPDGDTTDVWYVAYLAIKTALGVASLLNFTDINVGMFTDESTPTIPTDENAQREQALWIQYVDTVTNEYGTMSVPGADRTLFAQANTDEVDISANVAALALITVLETYAYSPANNSIEVTRMRLIGRAS